MNLGERIAQVRGSASRRIFAETLGIHPQTLYMYEKNKRGISIDVITKICDAHAISVEWLTKGVGPMKTSDTPSLPAYSDDTPAHQNALPLSPADQTPLSAKGRDVPVLGLAACGLSSWYNPGPMAFRLTFPVDHPYSPELFAVIAIGTSMQPEGIKQGFVLFCDPTMALTQNDVVFVEKRDGTVSVKTYKKRDDKWLYLQGWLPPNEEGMQKPYSEQLDIDIIKKIACVVLVKRKA